MPNWLSFNSENRTFSGTPTESNITTLEIKVTATDLAGATATSIFELEVVEEDVVYSIAQPQPDSEQENNFSDSNTVDENRSDTDNSTESNNTDENSSTDNNDNIAVLNQL